MSILGLIRDPNCTVTGQALFRGQDLRRDARRGAARAARPGHRDGLPGPDDLADAGLHGRLADRRGAAGARAGVEGRRPHRGRSSCSPRSASPTRPAGSTTTRTSSPAACASAPSSRWRWPTTRRCSSPTSRPRRSTSPIQAQVLDLLRRLQRDHGSSIVLITHDMGVVSQLADRVLVMYAGRAVEQGPKTEVFHRPQHPYTWGLLGSVPRAAGAAGAPAAGDPRLPRLGAAPRPTGCAFAPRCRHRHDALRRAAAAGRASRSTSTPAGCRAATGRRLRHAERRRGRGRR